MIWTSTSSASGSTATVAARGVDSAAAFGDGHALDAVDAAFELEPREHACAGDRGDRLLIAAELVGAGGDQFEPPALGLGIALVHAQQIAGEQRRLVAAGAGADFEHRRAIVGGVARQQLQRQRPLGLGHLRLQDRQLLDRHLADVGARIGEHLVEHLDLGAQPPQLPRRLGDRQDLGIVLGELHEGVGREIGRRHRRLQLLLARLDRRDPFGGDAGHCCCKASASPASGTSRCSPLARSLSAAAPRASSSSPRMIA